MIYTYLHLGNSKSKSAVLRTCLQGRSVCLTSVRQMGIPSAELGDHFRRLEDTFPLALQCPARFWILSTILGSHWPCPFQHFWIDFVKVRKLQDLKALLKLERANERLSVGSTWVTIYIGTMPVFCKFYTSYAPLVGTNASEWWTMNLPEASSSSFVTFVMCSEVGSTFVIVICHVSRL